MAEAAEEVVAKEEGSGKEVEVRRTRPARMRGPLDEMDRWFESFFPRGWMHPFQWDRSLLREMMAEEWHPRVDVIDRDDEIVVRAELPGVSKDDVDVSLSDNTVTIKGTTHREAKEEKGDYYRREMTRGQFTRTVALPGDVNASKAEAVYKDGVLEMTLPKVEMSKRRRIKVK